MNDTEYSKRLDKYKKSPLYQRIADVFPKKSETDIMCMFFEYKKDEALYFKDLTTLLEAYEMIGIVTEHEKARDQAFISKMLYFLLSCFLGFLYFKPKKDAEEIRNKYIKISIYEGTELIKESFYNICKLFSLSDVADQVFQFISIQDNELQKIYRGDTSVQEYVKGLGALGIELNKNAYIYRTKLPPPKHITEKYGL